MLAATGMETEYIGEEYNHSWAKGRGANKTVRIHLFKDYLTGIAPTMKTGGFLMFRIVDGNPNGTNTITAELTRYESEEHFLSSLDEYLRDFVDDVVVVSSDVKEKDKEKKKK
jgi:hypothetical protein